MNGFNETANSIWHGSPTWHLTNTATWEPHHDQDLRRAVSPSTPLILVGRNSNASGRTGALDAAKDLHGAADAMAARTGWDVRGALPSIEDLATFLMDAGNIVKSADSDGETFDNRFCLVDLRSQGLVLSISSGSARKVTQTFEQPHAHWLFRLATDPSLSIGGFFCKRGDRLSREPWSLGPLLQRLQYLERKRPIWAGDGLHGRWKVDDSGQLFQWVTALGAKTEADGFAAKRLHGQVSRTGSTMVDMKVPYALAAPPPPGTFRFQDMTKQWFLAIDTPANYPEQNRCASVLPNVRLADGKLADQAGAIQWFLSQFGRPGMGLRDLWPELVRRRYSTETLRSLADQGPDAYYGSSSKPLEDEDRSWDPSFSWSRSILDNLDFYETGVLERGVGTAHPTVSITNCFPASGSWATPEDFARIRIHRRADNGGLGVTRRWSWSGMPIVVNDVPGVLTPPRHHREGQLVRWSVDLPSGTDIGLRISFCPTIPDDELTAAIMNALLDADGVPLQALVDATSATAEIAALREQYEAVREEHGRLDRRTARQRRDLYDEDPETGEALLSSEMRLSLMEDLKDDQRRLSELRDSLQMLEQRLAQSKGPDAGVSVGGLQTVIDSLRDPMTSSYKEALRRAIRTLHLDIRDINDAGLRGYDARLQGVIVLQTSSGPHTIPFDHHYRLGAAKEADAFTLQGVETLRGGLSHPLILGSKEHKALQAACAALGADLNLVPLLSITDPSLHRVTVAALFSQTLPDEDPQTVLTLADLAGDPETVADFGNISLLATRMREVFAVPARAWLLREAIKECELLLLGIGAHLAKTGTVDLTEGDHRSATSLLNNLRSRAPERFDSWRLKAGRLTLQPCAHCGSPWLARLRLREPVGYVCLECRLDRRGIRWPQRFDAYVDQKDAWLSAGAPIEDLEIPCSRELRGDPRVYRPAADLSATERRKLVAAYSAREAPVTEVAQQFGITASTLYGIVKASGTPTRYSATGQRWRTEPGEV